MDVQTQPREARIFSILNDNDCPSFVIPPRQSSPAPSTSAASSSSPSSSPRQQRGERPSLLRQAQFSRTSSFSSAGSPPLLRQSSSSSKSSSSSMESSPSPITPGYNYLDSNVMPYDSLLRHDMVGPLPSPTTITPFLEQQLMINPNLPDQFSSSKQMQPMMPNQYSFAPAPLHPNHTHLPPVTSANVSVPPPVAPAANMQPKTTSPTTSGAPPAKKNKYPCPYAQTHNCQATFTTSGHAARHGKKHTGEKGVHCPICNKAFTRKDNMKQHERTHKNSTANSNGEDSSRRSKAAITKDAQKTKQARKAEPMTSNASRRSSMIHSPLSEVTSLAPTAIETPLNAEETNFYPDPPQMLMPIQNMQDGMSPNSLYPPLGDDMLLANNANLQQSSPTKTNAGGMGNNGFMPPTLVRGFSDLDTLAQAAESFDPYYQQGM